MRFPSYPGGLAGLTIDVASLSFAEPLLHGVLHALGYGRINRGEDWVLWAREGAQIVAQQAVAPGQDVRGVTLQLRAASRADVNAVCASARQRGWRMLDEPADRPFAPGYYSGVLGAPEGLALKLSIVHAWDDLPESCAGGQRVRVPGVDGVELGGYLYSTDAPVAASVIILHGYGSDATWTGWIGALLAQEGFAALSLSQRGWLGSTGDEDQGLRQPDDVLAAVSWLRLQPGFCRPVALLGFSQGGKWHCSRRPGQMRIYWLWLLSSPAPISLLGRGKARRPVLRTTWPTSLQHQTWQRAHRCLLPTVSAVMLCSCTGTPT